MPERQAVEYHDLKLDSGEDTPTTTVALMLSPDENGRPMWRERRLPPFPPRQSQGAVGYAHYDPDRDLVWSQKSWHDGALAQVYWDDGSTFYKYLQANGLDLRWEGVAVLGMLRSVQLGIAAPNVGFETAAASGWTLSAGGGGGVASVVTTSPRTGTYHLHLKEIAAQTQSTGRYSLPNSAAYVGRSITFGCYIKHVAGDAGTIGITVTGGTGSGTTSLGTGTASYAWKSVTVTVGAGATDVRLDLDTANGANASEFYIDDLVFYVNTSDTCVGLAEAKGKLYAAVGPLVLRWNETNDFWESVYCQAAGAAAIDIISFNDRIYVGYGTVASYVYGIGDDEVKATRTTYAFVDGGAGDDSITDSSNNFLADGFKVGDRITIAGSASNNYSATIKTVVAGTITLPTATTTTEAAGASVTIEAGWIASTRTAPDDKAGYWAIRRNQLWKSESANTVASATDATNAAGAAAWSTPYTVGNESTDITRLYGFMDSIVVGKEDGLHFAQWIHDEGAATYSFQFANVSNQFKALIDSDNFARGAEWAGRLYLIAAQQGLWYFDGEFLVNISSLLFSPRAGHTGRVRAITGDPSNLFVLVDSNTADATAAKETWLLSLREVSGKWFVHTLQKVPIGIIDTISVHGGYLYGFGRLYHAGLANYFMSTYRWTLPTKSIAPAFDATPAINTQGNFDTFVWDGGLPDEDKAFIALTIFCKGSVMDAQHTIVVDFGIDGAASTGTNLTTFSGTGNIQTIFFDTISAPETNAKGKTIQLNFEMNSDDTVSPELYAFALHATLRPDRVKTWELYVQIGEGVMQHNGQADPESKATKLSALSTLEQQVYPIKLTEDFDEDESTSAYRVQIIPGTLERVPAEERREGIEVYRLMLQEVALA